MKILLVRHGETDWNVQGKLQGWSDTELNERGKRQALERAERLAGEKIDAVYSSDLQRAAKTAEAIAEKHSLQVIKRRELREIFVGKTEGLTHTEAAEKFPEFAEQNEKDRFSTPYPGGESHAMLRDRVKKFLKEIQKKHAKGTIAIAAHNGTNRMIIGELLGMKPEEFMQIESPNNSIWEIDAEKKTAWLVVDGKRERKF